MASISSIILAAFLLLPAAQAAQLFGPGAPMTPALAAAAVAKFFSTPAPNLTAMAPVISYLSSLDLTDPDIRAGMAPVIKELQAAAATPQVHPEKFAILNHPAVRELTAKTAGASQALTRPTEALTLFFDGAAPRQPSASLVIRTFERLPATLRSTLAPRSDNLSLAQIRLLRHEIARLLPPEAAAFMAFLPQTSHGYLVDQFPKIPQVMKKVEKKISRQNQPDWSANGERYRAHQNAWFKRLAQVQSKLAEISSLEEGLPAPMAAAEKGFTHLSLGVLYGFSYGFATAMTTGAEDHGQDSLFGGNKKFVDRAADHYKESLRLLESEPEKNAPAVLLARFLLGKHALNGVMAYANSGAYTWDWKHLPPDPKAFEYLDLAKDMLGLAMMVLEGHMMGPFSGVHEAYYECRKFLLSSKYWEEELRAPSAPFDSKHKLARLKEQEQLLIDLLLAAPQSWVVEQFGKGRYDLLSRLINNIRWAKYPDNNEALYKIENSINSELTYPRFIEMLVMDGGYTELRPLLQPALPKP